MSHPTTIPTTTEPYRALLRHMIDNDEPCEIPMCRVTLLGHLLDGARPELVDLVRAEDPEQAAAERGASACR